ncbi:MAG: RCC1 domain-containing protein [Roseinatronobacter sp.]
MNQLLARFVVVISLAAPLWTIQGNAAPAAVSDLRGVRSVATGSLHSCAVSHRGDVWCWGWNYYGQLGNGSTMDSLTPRRVRTPEVAFVAVVTGSGHSCALSAAGAVWCLGYNGAGNVGRVWDDIEELPVLVPGLSSGARAIAAGDNHNCAIPEDGHVRCWGANGSGQLGNGTTTGGAVPVQVSGLGAGVRAITAGGRHTCALDREGRAFCWGLNDSGQLGDGTRRQRLEPKAVRGLQRRNRDIAAGARHSCAVTRGDRTFCWGDTLGAAGARSDSSNLPVRVPKLGRDVHSIVAGSFENWRRSAYGCALNAERQAWCWGDNSFGQLGDGSRTTRLRPVEVMRLGTGVRAIGGSKGRHSCAILENGRLFCRGYNNLGQLGDGTRMTATVPVRVAGQLHRNCSRRGRATGTGHEAHAPWKRVLT